uniref:Uncharacterized protein n=1 Tax=Mycena chlorophos TaxID=658473 RepID=A0ABQ0M083_MYCCL|nr:predicted protein [Mycena chlorophos]
MTAATACHDESSREAGLQPSMNASFKQATMTMNAFAQAAILLAAAAASTTNAYTWPSPQLDALESAMTSSGLMGTSSTTSSTCVRMHPSRRVRLQGGRPLQIGYGRPTILRRITSLRRLAGRDYPFCGGAGTAGERRRTRLA